MRVIALLAALLLPAQQSPRGDARTLIPLARQAHAQGYRAAWVPAFLESAPTPEQVSKAQAYLLKLK